MTHIYLSTFITGFKDVVADNLSKHVDIPKIDLLLDGLIVYQTRTDIKQIKQINYLNNTFASLKRFGKHNSQSVDKMLGSILTDNSIYKTTSRYITGRNSFRIIVSKENQLISANKGLLKSIEEKISKNINLRLNRLKPDIEFWLLIRSEGEAFFCMRLTKKPNQEKYLEKGELRPELASILCLISEPQDDDIFMDPFCGHGSIPIQRLFIPNCKYQEIIASDINQKLVNKLKAKIRKLQKRKTAKNFKIKNCDAFNLTSLSDSSINKIVTDPPWGLYDRKIDNVERFQNNMLIEFHRVLVENGILVVLAKKEIFDKALQGNKDKFKLLKEYSTLVSGQKASVYKIQTVK